MFDGSSENVWVRESMSGRFRQARFSRHANAAACAKGYKLSQVCFAASCANLMKDWMKASASQRALKSTLRHKADKSRMEYRWNDNEIVLLPPSLPSPRNGIAIAVGIASSEDLCSLIRILRPAGCYMPCRRRHNNYFCDCLSNFQPQRRWAGLWGKAEDPMEMQVES